VSNPTITQDLPPLPSPERLQALLFDAARMGRTDMLPALLRAGAEIEGLDERGHSPLVLASYNGQIEATLLLLELGAKPDGDPPSEGNTALMGVAFKGYDDIARLLIDAGARVDHANRGGQTALMMAALFGRASMVELLLEAGASPSVRDASGSRAADLAREQGNETLASRLDALAAPDR
jgi:ankyrin repeat protein